MEDVRWTRLGGVSLWFVSLQAALPSYDLDHLCPSAGILRILGSLPTVRPPRLLAPPRGVGLADIADSACASTTLVRAHDEGRGMARGAAGEHLRTQIQFRNRSLARDSDIAQVAAGTFVGWISAGHLLYKENTILRGKQRYADQRSSQGTCPGVENRPRIRLSRPTIEAGWKRCHCHR